MDYRLYFLNDAGHVKFRVELDCEDDDHAIQTARRAADGRAMELWNQDRQVKVFLADDALPGSSPYDHPSELPL